MTRRTAIILTIIAILFALFAWRYEGKEPLVPPDAAAKTTSAPR